MKPETMKGAAPIGAETYGKITPDLLEALLESKAALEHDVPSSCWATGPLTGDPIEDLVVCPGCRAIHRINAVLAKELGSQS